MPTKNLESSWPNKKEEYKETEKYFSEKSSQIAEKIVSLALKETPSKEEEKDALVKEYIELIKSAKEKEKENDELYGSMAEFVFKEVDKNIKSKLKISRQGNFAGRKEIVSLLDEKHGKENQIIFNLWDEIDDRLTDEGISIYPEINQ